MADSRQICGPCGEGFATEEQYLDHQCVETGFTPRDPENLGEGFMAISQAALERGAEREESGDLPAEDVAEEVPTDAKKRTKLGYPKKRK